MPVYNTEETLVFVPKKSWLEILFKKQEMLNVPEKKKDITDLLIKGTKDDLAPIPTPYWSGDPGSKGISDIKPMGNVDGPLFDILQLFSEQIDFILSFFQ